MRVSTGTRIPHATPDEDAHRPPQLAVLSAYAATCAVADEILLDTAAALLGEAAPRPPAATVDPNADDTFIQGLDVRKVPYSSKEAAIKAAHAVCARAAASASYTEAVAAVQEELPALALAQAATVLGKAVQVYCPQDTNRLHK